MQSVHITTNVVSSYPTHDEVYSMQHYVTQVGGFFVGDFFGGGRATHFKKLVLNSHQGSLTKNTHYPHVYVDFQLA
jgi:hypothetical protein